MVYMCNMYICTHVTRKCVSAAVSVTHACVNVLLNDRGAAALCTFTEEEEDEET